MRYLGLSLGMAVALGLTTAIGTIGPPIFRGTLGELAATTSGQITFLGILLTLVGIVIVARAGRAKASIILFSTLWGFALKEWSGASRGTRALVWSGIGVLIGSTIVIGLGNYYAAK